LHATQHLGQLIRDSPKVNEWTLRLLLTQLYDPDVEVASLAMRYLDDVCDDVETLELVVKMQPTIDHLGDTGHPLLLRCKKKQLIRNEAFSLSFVTDAVFFLPHHRFMSSSVGFRYLYHSGYIDREVDSWFYVSQRFYIKKRFMTTRRTELNLVNNRHLLGSKLHVRGAS